MKTISDVRNEMDRAYANGTAYQSELPFDVDRGESIRAATLCLAVGTFPPRAGPETRTLDVGSGQGGIAAFWPHTNITGIEISEVAVLQAREAHPAVTYRCSAIEDYELGAGERPYDLVVAQESIEHWTDAAAGMRRIYDAMSPNGSLIITTPNRDSLHCRMRRKLELGEAPLCSHDHIHEFGFAELIEFVSAFGFSLKHSLGVGLLPYWTMEDVFSPQVRFLTDRDPEVVEWFETMGRSVPPEFAFIQCHRFEKSASCRRRELPRCPS